MMSTIIRLNVKIMLRIWLVVKYLHMFKLFFDTDSKIRSLSQYYYVKRKANKINKDKFRGKRTQLRGIHDQVRSQKKTTTIKETRNT